MADEEGHGAGQSAPHGYHDGDARSLQDEESRVRSKLSNERTFAAWMRTAVAVAVVGLAVGRFMATEDGGLETWFLVIGGGFVLAGVGLFWFAARNYFQSREQMKKADFQAPKKFLLVIAGVLSVLSLGLLMLLVMQSRAV